MIVCVFKQKTAYEMRISDWSSDVCSSDLPKPPGRWLAPYQTPDGQMKALTGHQPVNRRSREYEKFGPASLRAACHSRPSEIQVPHCPTPARSTPQVLLSRRMKLCGRWFHVPSRHKNGEACLRATD